MHQPYYRDMKTGENSMPWVRLHGIHSYYDMVRLHESMPGLQATINFVPSLILQIREYAEDGKSDAFLEHTEIPAENLNNQQKAFILRHFFMANHEQMIRPYSAYFKLMEKRGIELDEADIDQAIRFFSTQDYLDIQVFYNLTWFGFEAREEIPQIKELLLKNGKFTEDDKRFVIEAQRRILKSLLDAIKRVGTCDYIELSTTPFYHPILPLLIDTNFASRAMPKVKLPPRLTALPHAKYQLEKGISYMEGFLGKRPSGMWPAEGSVCPEMIPLLSQAGIKWIATDQGILLSSGIKGTKEEIIFQPYIAEHDNAQVAVVFRDREISDLISFTYYRMGTENAVEDFIKRIKLTAESCPKDRENIITIILDGENPWEHYPNSGKDFLYRLFQRIHEEGIQTTTISRFIEKFPPKNTIKKIHSGSWINANYAIWIGKDQKNKGWGYIKRTLDEVGRFINPSNCNDADSQGALNSFAAACGSDWFWWFDDDFASAFKGDFDRIFRTHLKNVFSFLKRDLPLFLFDPIYRYEEQPELLKPLAFIYPEISGKAPSFFDWINAAKINVHRFGGTMAQSEELFETIYFGFNPESFFLRIDPIDKKKGFVLNDGEEIAIYIHNQEKKYKLRLFREGEQYKLAFCDEPEKGFCICDCKIQYVVSQVFEMGVPFKPLGYTPGEDLTLVITIVRNGVEVRRYSHLHFEVPDENYELLMWTV
jgi:alpha-amylase/alpha-mannosidase (GH57 family)